MNYIDDFEELKRQVSQKLSTYIKDQEFKSVEIDPDIKKEYENQKRYLENSVGSLKKRLQKETQYHKDDNLNVMDQNLSLIKEIKKLRGSVKTLKSNIRNIQGKFSLISSRWKGHEWVW